LNVRPGDKGCFQRPARLDTKKLAIWVANPYFIKTIGIGPAADG
jgi:hypothetical protein